jgi:hypothetical protein
MTKTSFDELKNQWGWGGFTTQRCRLEARMLALFLRLVEHLRSSRRSEPASRGHHQPAVVPVGHRDADTPCPANDDPRHQSSRQARPAARVQSKSATTNC